MRKTLIGLSAAVACVIGLGMATQAEAGVVVTKKTTTVVKNYGHDRGHNYYREYGTKYRGGYYFSGRHHDHWGYRVWNERYHRYHYYEPSLRVYYYYDYDLGGYYPCD